MLITIEGMDGVGKDTVALALKDRLVTEKGIDPNKITIINEPATDGLGEVVRREVIRDDLDYDNITQALLMIAARSDNITRTVIPLIVDHGHIVICTRSSLSTMVYQLPKIHEIHRSGIIKAINSVDLISTSVGIKEKRYLLTCPLDVIIERMESRGTLDVFERKSKDELSDRHQLYIREALSNGYQLINNVDKPEVVASSIIDAIYEDKR